MPAESTPLSTPWSVSPSPELLDDLIVEVVDSENAPGTYVRIAPGTPHPDQTQYPGYLFLKQVTLSHNKVQRYWSTPAFQNQDLYNYERDYVAESVSHPIFVRTYKTRRDQYSPVAALSLLTGVWNIRLTNAGTGYNPDLPPAVTIGGPGTGATALSFVNPDGTLSWIRITSEGTGYVSTPTVTIAPPPSGTTATATATVQSSSCVMVSQKTQNFSEDDPRFSLFLIEIRAYKTLPGPVLVSRGFRPDGTMILSTERDVVASTMPDEGDDIISSTLRAVNSIEGKLITERLVEADGTTPIMDDEGYVLFHTEQGTNAYLGTIMRLRPASEALPSVGAAAPLGSGFIIETHQIEIKNSQNVIQAITVKPLPTVSKYDRGVDRKGVRLVVQQYDDTAANAATLANAAYGTGVIEIDVSAIDTVQSRIRISKTADADEYPEVTVDMGWDDIVRGSIWATEYWTLKEDTEPNPGDIIEIDGSERVIIDFKIRPSSDPLKNITTIFTIATDRLLNPFVEYIERGEQAPGIFQFLIASGTSGSVSDFVRPGYVFNYQVPRSGKWLHKVVHILLNGGLDPNNLPEIWQGVDSPGAASNVFPIRANTVHPTFSIANSDGPLEFFPASSPPFYRKGTTLLVGAPCVLWRGTIFRLSLWYFNELGFSEGTSTPAVYIQTAHLPKSPDGGFQEPSDITRLVYDGQDNDRFYTYGTSNGEETSEEIEISNYGPVRGDVQWNNIYSIRVISLGAVDPTVRATGTKASIRFDFADNPSPGETWLFRVVGAQYGPTDYGYTFVFTQDGYVVTGGATIGGVNINGYYIRDGDVNGDPAFYRLDGLFSILSDGSNYYIQTVPAGANFFTGGATPTDPYAGSGTTTGTPTVTLEPGVALNTANRIKIGTTTNITKSYLVQALNEVGVPGLTYWTVTPVPFFDGETAVDSAVNGRVVLTDHVADNHTITYTGTAGGTMTYIDNGTNGAKVLTGAAGEDQYRYNGQNLYNQDRRQIIPPNLVNAETRTIEYFSEKDIEIKYVMSAEVSVEYQINASGIWVALPTVTGDDLATVEVDNVTEIIFRINNSASNAKMLRLYTQWTTE